MLVATGIAGFFVCLTFWIWVTFGRSERRRYLAVMATPSSRIADAAGTGAVEIQGRVLAGERGLLTAPFSGRRGVWVGISVMERARRGTKNSTWRQVHAREDGLPFFLDDGSGPAARVEPNGGNLLGAYTVVATSGNFAGAPPAVQQYLQSQGIGPANFFRTAGTILQFNELVLEEGATTFVLGAARRIAGPPTPEGYRAGPSTQLVLGHGPTLDSALRVSATGKATVAAPHVKEWRTSVVLLVVALVALLATSSLWLATR